MYTKDWTEAPFKAFPRVTMCDFKVRRLGNVHRYTIQCTLPINMYNEKIYMFLWFWFVFVAFISTLDLLIWIIRYCLRGDKIRFLKNHLNFYEGGRDQKEKEQVGDFLDNYLRQDGVFLLRLIAHNTNNLTTTEIVCSVFEKWKTWNNFKALEGSSSEPTAPSDDNDGIADDTIVALDDVDGKSEKLKRK